MELIVDLTELAGPEHRLAAVRERLGASLRIVASSERSQAANREEALRRLAARLERASRLERPRRATRPPASAVETRLEDKRRRSALKAGRRAADQE